MQLIARFVSEKYDDSFRLAEKEATLADFKQIPEAPEYNGLIINLQDVSNKSFDTMTVRVTAETIESLFGIEVKEEDQMYEDSLKAFNDGERCSMLVQGDDFAILIAIFSAFWLLLLW